MLENTEATIRLSQKRSRSNPILESERAYCSGVGVRDQERRQVERLQTLQHEGAQLHQIPKMIRTDTSALKLSEQRIGVVGLVVDNDGEGFVTQLQVRLSSTWDISVDLPFQRVHIQSLLLRILGERGLNDSLPELLAYQVSDTLGDRCEGDSMDIACLLAIVDASQENACPLLDSAVAVISPTSGDDLEASKSVKAKLNAFKREFGRGTLIVRHADDETAANFDELFNDVWPVRDVHELARRLHESGLLKALLNRVSLTTNHSWAISSQTARLLSSETTHGQAEDFIRRLNARITDETPLKIKLEVSYAEEDLHRHCGNFELAIEVRDKRVDFESNPLISSYERAAQSDNRHAASLYDAHRFSDAIECLDSWLKKFDKDSRICLPETRAILFNTLARCLVVIDDPKWEQLFERSREIQTASDPGNLPITENHLAHAYLKCGRFEHASRLLDKRDSAGDPYRTWLRAEISRQAGETWTDDQCEEAKSISVEFHVHGFACQAIARQQDRTVQSRVEFLEKAKTSFGHGLDHDVTNVKRLLRACCELGIAAAKEDRGDLEQAIEAFRQMCACNGFEHAGDWYRSVIEELSCNLNWDAVENVFARMPHL